MPAIWWKFTGGPELTHNEAYFTVMIIVAAGHHGPHRVIDHSQDVNVKVLQGDGIQLDTLKSTQTQSCFDSTHETKSIK